MVHDDDYDADIESNARSDIESNFGSDNESESESDGEIEEAMEVDDESPAPLCDWGEPIINQEAAQSISNSLSFHIS